MRVYAARACTRRRHCRRQSPPRTCTGGPPNKAVTKLSARAQTPGNRHSSHAGRIAIMGVLIFCCVRHMAPKPQAFDQQQPWQPPISSIQLQMTIQHEKRSLIH
eukprot:6200940-Pleurochrysis_carterae.AAC.1